MTKIININMKKLNSIYYSLIFSSSLFSLILLYIILFKNLSIFLIEFIIVLTITIVSISRWTYINNFYIWLLDNIVAKLGGIYFFIKGIIYIKYKFIGLIISTIAYYMFYESNNQYDLKNKLWYIYHFLFHIFAIIGIILVISNL